MGELLLHADATARGLLFDVTGDDAPAMLRTWGEVVQCAGELWHALPTPPDGRSSGGLPMAQLEAISRGMHRTQVRQGWPGDGESDQRLLQLSEIFGAAGELVTRHASPPRVAQQRAMMRDVEAARMRTMHALYVGAHAVGVAVRDHIRGLQEAPRVERIWTRTTRGIPRGQEALERLTAFEHLAGSYISGCFPISLGGERHEEYAGLNRLSDAIASWDVQVHRTVAEAISPASLAAIARTQAMVSRASLILLRAAAYTGVADPTTYEYRIAPALEGATRAASHIAGQWGSLTNAVTRRVDPALWSVDAELQAAMRELIHDKTVVADPTLIAQRADLRDAGPVVAAATAAGLEIACVAHDAAVHDTSLTAPAQAMLQCARAGLAAAGPGDVGDLGDSLNPTDLQHNRVLPLIAPVRNLLVCSSAENIHRMASASSAVGALWRAREPAVSVPRLSRHTGVFAAPSLSVGLAGPAIS